MRKDKEALSRAMHPSSKYEHQSVLSLEAVNLWHTKPGGFYVDTTLGLGGHSESLLAFDPKASVLGLDRDTEALKISSSRLSKFGSRFSFIKENFMNLESALKNSSSPPPDGILTDLGVSSLQLDRAERGFSFQRSGPLDMRMDVSCGQTALELIHRSSQEELTLILRNYGEERLARPIARRLKEFSSKGDLMDTLACAKIAASVYGVRRSLSGKMNPATRTFQALRIAVNQEALNLDRFLEQAPHLLAKGGHLVCISFHSLEDRKVKESFRSLSKGCICPSDFPKCVCGKVAEFKILTKKPVTPNEKEISENPRSRSAKMRVLEKKGL